LDASVVIPYRPGDPHRDRLFSYVEAVAHAALGVEAIVADDLHQHDGLFNHGQAINIAASQASGSVLVIVDADTVPDDAAAFRNAVEATVADGVWRLPERYVQLREHATDTFMDGRDKVTFDHTNVEWIGEKICWSGLVIVPAAAFWQVGGADERFVGHGPDDVALALALNAIYGTVRRYPGAAVHLWHPRGDQEENLHEHAPEQARLATAYIEAAGSALEGDFEPMTAMVAAKPPPTRSRLL
jgi:hypothetical protein